MATLRIGFTTYIKEGERKVRSFADWLNLSHTSQENVQCMMGYIVNLTVILDGTAAHRVKEYVVQDVTSDHVNSGRRDSIHRDIRSFVTGAFAVRFAVPQQDLVLEKIIELIKKYCAHLEYN